MECTKNKILNLSQSATPPHGSTVHRKPLQPTDRGFKTADWLSPTGLARILPTNIRDIPHHINVNSIRAGSFAAGMGEGGNTYSASTNIDNFVEERSDTMYSYGSVPSIVRCKKMYQTETMERQNEALPTYKAALAAQGLAAKFCTPPLAMHAPKYAEHHRLNFLPLSLKEEERHQSQVVPGQDHRSRHRVAYAPNYIGYSSHGFVRGTAQKSGDATAKHAQGAAWVGTTPLQLHKSVQSTMLNGMKAEFQANHPSASGKIKVIVGCTPDGLPPPSANLDRQVETCRAGEVHARQWKSMYQTEICKISQ